MKIPPPFFFFFFFFFGVVDIHPQPENSSSFFSSPLSPWLGFTFSLFSSSSGKWGGTFSLFSDFNSTLFLRQV